MGIDTPSIDPGPSKDFAAHVALYDANVAIFENVAPPMKIRGGSGAPLRIVATIRTPLPAP